MSNVNVTTTIEPYRKGAQFGEWVERLEFYFSLNNVSADAKRACFITLGGPVIFHELKLLFPTSNLTTVSYEDMVAKLRTRLDKTESDLIQRLKFNNRIQQPDETVEDFVLSVKLQAEFCSFEGFKEVAIRDRILAGIREKSLRERLLNEDKLTLEKAEKIIATWEIAGKNARNLSNNDNDQYGRIASLTHPSAKIGSSMKKLLSVYNGGRTYNGGELDNSPRVSVKDRLGRRPYSKRVEDTARFRRQSWGDAGKPRSGEWRQKPNYAEMTCNFCGVKGHIKRKCFKLKNMKRDTVNMLNDYEQEASTSTTGHIANLLNRMRTEDSDSDVDDGDSGELTCMMVSSVNRISDPCLIELVVEGKFLKMEIDCGSSVQTGSVRLMAHRNQLRVATSENSAKPNLTMFAQRPDEELQSSGNDIETEECLDSVQRSTKDGRKRRRPEESLDSTPMLRRSKRKRTAKVDADFIYK
ncbi:uncharacterized protein LOC134289499 [Aedes albopictus]|uniref:CCHC-type domain-containing protein n=1 Tax=Aedes albopictus TaxID=7160 RepID=A0ABM1XYT1_AEDAL